MKKEFIFRVVLVAAIFFLVYQFGVKPIFNHSEESHTTDRKDWSAQLDDANGEDYDVVVYGAEPQGVSAAISAARLGARTLLISEGKDVGGTIAGGLISELEAPVNGNNLLLNRGILQEFYSKLDSGFSDSKYVSTMEQMIRAEKKLSVLYNTSVQGVNMNSGSIESLKLNSEGKAKVVSGRMFIDASDGGNLLEVCKVPSFEGSGDLNMPESFAPACLNFEMAPPDGDPNRTVEIKKLVNNTEKLFEGLKQYDPLDIHTRFDEMSIYYPGDGNVVIRGLQLTGVNVLSESDRNRAWRDAAKEAENLALFLTRQFKQFNGWKLSRVASQLQVRESRHYRGKYILTVNDILDNKYFDDTIAMGSYPVLTSKFANRGTYMAGKPAQYGIPLGCLVPEKTTNLLMAGPRISYSSLASSSAGTIGTSIATGEASGVVAVFCLVKNENPSFLLNAREQLNELRTMLLAQNMYLPNQKTGNRNSGNWSYPAARQLISLGLVAGGSKNNLNFQETAKQKDLAFILLNGIYRLDKESYSLELDARIRPLITEDPLSFINAVKVLGALYKMDGDTNSIYEKLCDQSRINDVMQLRMKGRKPLTMEDVYYLGAYSIRSYTGKDIPD